MTLPHEKIWSMKRTRQFLLDLQDPKKTPKVPSSVRKEASSCLRHYPYSLDQEAFLVALIEKQKMREMIKTFKKSDKRKEYLFAEQVDKILERYGMSNEKMNDRDENGVPYWEK